jgi:hypothetical protein
MYIFLKKDINDIAAVVEDNVEFFFGNSNEIGSSDVSSCVRAICSELTSVSFDVLSDIEVSMIRCSVNNKISELYDNG